METDAPPQLSVAQPWQACLELAWEAYANGTIPVGAVVVDAAGTVVSRGRNRMYELVAPEGEIAHSPLAHAEINALARLDPDRRYEDHALYTTLEPCLLCVGACVMTTVGAVYYAGSDPYGGGDGGLIGSNPHVERLPLTLHGPRDDAIGVLSSALFLAFYLQRRPHGHVVAAYRTRQPWLVPVARELIAHKASDAAAGGVPLNRFLDTARDALTLTPRSHPENR